MLPSDKLVSYYIDFKRVIMRRLVVGIADGIMKVDGKVIYEAKDLRVGLFHDSPAAAPEHRDIRRRGNTEDMHI